MGNRAHSHGTFEFKMTLKQGGKTACYPGKLLDILKNQVDGSWKITIDCCNDNLPSELVGFGYK